MYTKSTIKKISDIDYYKTIQITNIKIPPQFMDKQKEIFKQAQGSNANKYSDQQIEQIIQNNMMQRNIIEGIKKYLRPFFNLNFDSEEIKTVSQNIQKQDPNVPSDALLSIAENIIYEQLLMNFFASDWEISVSDKDVEDNLEAYYKATNQSIREIKNDKAKLEDFKKQILTRKTLAAFATHFHVVTQVDLTPGMGQPQVANTEQNKSNSDDKKNKKKKK